MHKNPDRQMKPILYAQALKQQEMTAGDPSLITPIHECPSND